MNKSKAYQSTAHVHIEEENFTPHQTVQQLMQMALEKLALARSAMESNHTSTKAEAISQVITVLGILQGGLQPQPGHEELAYDLDNLYHYMMNQALEANRHNQLEIIDELIRLMSTIKSGWDQIQDVR